MDTSWTFAFEAAISQYELSVALSSDSIGDRGTVCALLARAVRSALIADLLYQGTTSLALAGNNLLRLLRQSAALRSLKVEDHTEAEAALLSRVLIVTTVDAGPDYLPRELFCEIDVQVCAAACRHLLDLITMRLFQLSVADLIVRNAPLRNAAWDDPTEWVSLLPLTGATQ